MQFRSTLSFKTENFENDANNPYLLLQIQSIKQHNSALREKLDTGLDEFRPSEVTIFTSLEFFSTKFIS